LLKLKNKEIGSILNRPEVQNITLHIAAMAMMEMQVMV